MQLPTLRECKSEAVLDECWITSTIFCWEIATIETFHKKTAISRDTNYTIPFNALCQSVRQIKYAEKRTLVYKIVIRIKIIFSIVTVILSRHKMNDICAIL